MITASHFYSDADVIDVIFEGLLPGVAARVEEVETTTGVLQSDARTTAILGGLGIVGVVAIEDKRAVLLCQADVDGGRGVTVGTMLKSVLNQRDKYKWSH